MSAFWSWILFGDGAEKLEGSWLSDFLLWDRAPEWTAHGLRILAAALWIFHAYWLCLRYLIVATG